MPVKFGLDEEGVVPLVGEDGFFLYLSAGGVEEVGESVLLIGVKADVGADTEEEEGNAGAALQGLGEGGHACGGGKVEALPGFEDEEVAVGIEAGHEFFALVEHVGLVAAVKDVGAEAFTGRGDLVARTFAEGIETDEGFVGNHPRESESVDGTWAGVVIAIGEGGVAFDGGDLLEVEDALKRADVCACANEDGGGEAFGMAHGEGEGQEATDGGSDGGVDAGDAEVVEQAKLALDDIGNADAGEAGAEGFACGGVGGGRPGGAVATAEVVSTDDEVFFSIKGFSGTDEGIPPTGLAFIGPEDLEPWHGGGEASCVLAARHGMEKQDGVGVVGVEGAVGLVGESGSGQGLPGAQWEGFLDVEEPGVQHGGVVRHGGLDRGRRGYRRCARCRRRGG